MKLYNLHKLTLSTIVFILLVTCNISLQAQSLKANGGFLVKAQIFLGKQNQGIKIGAYGLGAINFGNIALESGLSLYCGYLLKKHNVKIKGFNYGYDAFILAGIGKNSNLLVSSFMKESPLLAIFEKEQHFYGFGFGVEKEFLPKQLIIFNQRLGKFLMRFSKNNYSFNIQIKNDFKLGKVFNGEGTDFGATGMLQLSYSAILNPLEIYHIGMGVELFTPRPDYNRTPNNNQNSADGSKNVWHTIDPYGKLFYANLYGFGSYQNKNVAAFLKSGINSQKLGAYIQNTLHDSFGLNPRYPWNVSKKDLFYIKASSSVINTFKTNE